jgi:lysophospholipid acyltransferase (LPLAT)-like uncharacterized protein
MRTEELTQDRLFTSDLRMKLKLFCFSCFTYLVLKALRLSVRCFVARTPNGIDPQGKEQLRLQPKEPNITVFWHNRQIALPWFFAKGSFGFRRPVSVLISQHFDGRLIADVIAKFGIGSVAGSSSRGAVAAAKTMLSELQAGNNIAITPDGPRGPIYKAKVGAARLAFQIGVPVYPVAFAASKYWQFHSWDEFRLPKPFSKIAVFFADPIQPHAEEDEDTFRQRIEDALNSITQEADSFFH